MSEPAPLSGSSPSADRQAKLEADLDKLSRKVSALEMDWNEWYDKFRRLYARIAKRQSREEELEAETSRQDDPGRTNGTLQVSQYPPSPAARRNY